MKKKQKHLSEQKECNNNRAATFNPIVKKNKKLNQLNLMYNEILFLIGK